MKYRDKLLLDRYVGNAVCAIIAPLVAVADALRRRLGRGRPPAAAAGGGAADAASSEGGGAERVVVLKILGMGSILQTQRMVRALRAQRPGARLTLVTSAANAQLARRLEGLFDEFLYLRDQGLGPLAADTLRLLWWCWTRRPALFVNLEVYSAYASFLAGAGLAARRFGFYRYWVGYRSWLHTDLVYFNFQRHISEVYLQVAVALGARPEEGPHRPIRVTAEDEREAAGWLSARGLEPGGVLVVNVNSSELMLERRWPAERFARYLEVVCAATGLAPVLMGSPGERPYVDHVRGLVAEPWRARVLASAGEVSFGAALAMIRDCRAMVTNDSGPFHFAVALGAPTLGLFGPCHPAQYGPATAEPRVRTLYREVYCSPCIHNTFDPPCGGDNVCMQRIAVSEALDETLALLKGWTAGRGGAAGPQV